MSPDSSGQGHLELRVHSGLCSGNWSMEKMLLQNGWMCREKSSGFSLRPASDFPPIPPVEQKQLEGSSPRNMGDAAPRVSFLDIQSRARGGWEMNVRTTGPGLAYLLLLLEGRSEGIQVVHRDPGLPLDFLERGSLN